MAKTIAHYISDLRIDLKDSGALWSDAELTRCVERAVSDLSRFLPCERSMELTIDAEVTGESFTTPAAASDTYFVNAVTLVGEADGSTMTIAAQRPDVPRPVKLTVADANLSINQFVVIVKGYDSDNRYIEENFYLEGGLVQTGKQYFAYITQVELDKINGNGPGDTLSLGTSAADGVYVQLANKPIKFHSEAITGYTRNTDYEMDYYRGRIAMKSGGSMVAATAYTLASYVKSRIDIDLSLYIDDLIRVDRIEYPAGNVPQQHSTLEVWGKILTIAGGHTTQAEMSDEEHLVIRYLAPHSPPNAQSPGSFPNFLDTTVQLAASAYALLIKALQYEHLAATDLAGARTNFALTAAVHALIATALGKVTTYATDMDTALDAAVVQFAAAATALGKINDDSGRVYLTDADGALDSAATSFSAAGTALGKINSDSGRTYLTDADTALDAAVAALVKVTTYLEDNTSEDAKYWLTKITTDIAALRTAISTAVDAAASVLAEVETVSLDKATTGAEALLDTGDDYIDSINDGSRVPENYREYAHARSILASARSEAATALIQEAMARLSNLNSYITQAIGGWAEIARTFAQEASQRVNEAVARVGIADRYISEASQRTAAGNGYVAEASQRVAIADRYLTQAAQHTNAGNGYVAEAEGRFAMCRAFVDEATQQLAKINAYLQEAAQYQQVADSDLAIADRFHAEAVERRNEAWAIWSSPNQIAPNYVLGQRGQLT